MSNPLTSPADGLHSKDEPSHIFQTKTLLLLPTGVKTLAPTPQNLETSNLIPIIVNTMKASK